MNIFRDKNGKARRQWLLIAIAIFTVFLVAVPPAPAQAQTATEVTQLLNKALLGLIQGIMSAINTFMQGAQMVMFKTGFSSVVAAQNGTAMEVTDAINKNAQFTADHRKLNSMTETAAKYQGDATAPDAQSEATCGIIGASIEHENSRAATRGMVIAAQQLDAGVSTGPQAGTGLDRTAQIIQDVCQLGFVTANANGSLPQQMGNCSPDSNFPNAHMVPAYLCQDELMVPTSGVTQKPNGFISFAGVTGSGNTDCGKNPKCFAAAYLFCEIQNQQFVTPVVGNNRKVTPQDYTAILKSWQTGARRVGSDNACMARIKKRMKCGSGSSSAAGGGTDCNKAQIEECKHMKNDMHIDDPRLDDCIGGAGMSPYLAAKIKALAPCTNATYGSQTLPGNTGDYVKTGDTIQKCSVDQEKFEDEEDQCMATFTLHSGGSDDQLPDESINPDRARQ